MKGYVSFHPIDLSFFDDLIAPLVMGRKVDPEAFVRRATRLRRNAWVARRFASTLDRLIAESVPPETDPGASRWTRLRANIERIDFKADPLARKAANAIDPDLHLDGRPFFIAEGSAEKVAAAVDAFASAETESAVEKLTRTQIALLDAELSSSVVPDEIYDPSSDPSYRSELLSSLTKIHELARLAREGRSFLDGDADPRPAVEALPEVLPWLALSMHARVAPFWIGRDVDGLETICRAAGVQAPDCLSPAWRVYGEACEAFPSIRDALGLEVRRPRDIGAFVAAEEVGELLSFLTENGARIIAAAARGGEGPAATSLLRKIKECAVYAQRHGYGYLEASGILPPER